MEIIKIVGSSEQRRGILFLSFSWDDDDARDVFQCGLLSFLSLKVYKFTSNYALPFSRETIGRETESYVAQKLET